MIAEAGRAAILGASLTLWFIAVGLLVVYGFLRWEGRLEAAAAGNPTPCSRWCGPSMLRNRQLTGGLGMFFSQFMIQAGAFFAVPLFLSVVLGLNALQTGVRLVPLSIALLITAIGIPKLWPKANPRRVVRIGLLVLIVGVGFLVAGMDPDADATVMNIPMMLMGLGLGALASQLGAVTVSAVSEKETAEVGGLQNTATNLGASMGTALIGSVLIATLSTVALTGVADSPEVSDAVKAQISTELVGGVPFVSDAQLDAALDCRRGQPGGDRRHRRNQRDRPAGGAAGRVRAGRPGRHRRVVHHGADSRPSPPGAAGIAGRDRPKTAEDPTPD